MIKNFLKQLASSRAESILEVTIALFVIGVGVTTSSMIIQRSLTVSSQSKQWMQAVFFAKEGLEGVRNKRDTNRLRYSDPGCWKTIETANVCTASSPMMADSGADPSHYAIFFNHLDFTWDLIPVTAPQSEFNDSAILARQPNSFSIHKRFLDTANDKNPIFIANDGTGKNTNFYRKIEIASQSIDLDQDSSSTSVTDQQEVILVTSTVKWPYKSKVNTYSVSTVLTNYQN